MPVNKRQHFVSQFTIRSFMGERDRLFCLDKATLQARDRTHGNRPAEILNEAYYYTTDSDDFDGEIVQPLEKKLAPICSQCIAEPDRPLTLDTMAVLVDWCALSVARSVFFAYVAPIACDNLSAEDKAELPTDGKAMTLAARRTTFYRVQHEMRSVELMFRFLKSPRPFGYYLTDQPVAPVPFRRAGAVGPMLLPLAHNLIMAVVPNHLASDFYRMLTPNLEWLTLVQCGWAQRLIYSADLDSLDFAAFVLSEGSGAWPKTMRESAKQPFFGLGEPSELKSIWAASSQLA